jgi:hypothetical protein
MGTFLVICLALAVWYAAGFVAFEGINRHVKGLVMSRRRGEPLGNDLYMASLELLLATGLFVVGTTMMAAVLVGRQVATMVFGVGLLASAFLVWRHARKTKSRKFLYFVAGLGLLLSGSSILAVGL